MGNWIYNETQQFFRELRVSITHHSNAIEGISLTFGETKRLLEKGTTADGKPLSEQLIVLGFAKAYDVIIREATNPNNNISSSFIKDLHYIMFEDALKVSGDFIAKPIGAYRMDERYIRGVDIELSAPNKISQDLENLLFQYANKKINLEQIADFHIKFEQIHPFADGNGRIGRLLMAFQYIQNDFIPPLILNETRQEYLKALNNKSLLAEFLKQSSLESKKLIKV